jgi:hypothetical protein
VSRLTSTKCTYRFNRYDVKDLELYQQIVIYVVPIITNMGFVSIAIVIARLFWFEKRFGQLCTC